MTGKTKSKPARRGGRAAKKPKGSPRPKSKVSLLADRLPNEALKVINDRLRQLHTDAAIAREINDEFGEDVAKLYRSGLNSKHIGHYRRHRFETLRGSMHQAGEMADTLAAELGLDKDGKDAVLREALQRMLFGGLANIQDSDVSLVAKIFKDIRRLELRGRALDIDKARVDLQRDQLTSQQKKLVEMDPFDLYLDIAKEVLKRLRTRKELRKVIDSIKEELLTELSNGAESYRKRVQA